jgi:hypothetical protein
MGCRDLGGRERERERRHYLALRVEEAKANIGTIARGRRGINSTIAMGRRRKGRRLQGHWTPVECKIRIRVRVRVKGLAGEGEDEEEESLPCSH